MLRKRALGERLGPSGARVGCGVYYASGAALPRTRLWWDALDAKRNGSGVHSIDGAPGTSVLSLLNLVRVRCSLCVYVCE